MRARKAAQLGSYRQWLKQWIGSNEQYECASANTMYQISFHLNTGAWPQPGGSGHARGASSKRWSWIWHVGEKKTKEKQSLSSLWYCRLAVSGLHLMLQWKLYWPSGTAEGAGSDDSLLNARWKMLHIFSFPAPVIARSESWHWKELLISCYCPVFSVRRSNPI